MNWRHQDLRRQARESFENENRRRRALPRAVLSCGILLNALHFAPKSEGPLLACLWIIAGLAALGLLAQFGVLLRPHLDDRGRLPAFIAYPILLLALAAGLTYASLCGAFSTIFEF